MASNNSRGAPKKQDANLQATAQSRVIQAVDKVLGDHRRSRDEPLTLSNGITLRYRPVPRVALEKAVHAIEIPDPPTFEKDGEVMENRLDPNWQRAVTEAQRQRLLAYNEVLFKLGFEVADVPDDCYGPSDDDWIDELRFAGYDELPPSDEMSALERRYWWLTLYALADPVDYAAALMTYTPRTGITVQEVMDAVSTFPSDAPRAADHPAGDEERGKDGDREGEPDTGAGKRAGRTRRRET